MSACRDIQRLERGRYIDGVWHCDCSPRRPAARFQSRKQNQNFQKWFNRCQKPQGEQCGFFLWDHDAKPREKEALENPSKTEAAAADPITPARRPPVPSPSYTMTTEPSASKHKRKRSVDLDNKYDSSEFDEDDLNEALSQAETPCNTAKRADFITPTGKRRNFGLDMNQCSRVEARPLQTPRAKRIASGSPFSLKTPKTNSNMFTPSASSDGKPISNSLKNAVVEELATDVFDLLQGSGMRLDECIERDLRALLNQHVKSAEGYRRGRDASRAQVKAKDAKIAELTFRIGTLEAELQAEKTTVENLQWEAENGTSVG